MFQLTNTFSRRAQSVVVLAGSLTLGGCAVTSVNLQTCAETTTHVLGGELAAIRLNTGQPFKLNEDCQKAKDAATIVFMKNDRGEYSPWALKFGEIYHSKAEPKVREFFDKYLSANNYTADQLGAAARKLALPAETIVSQSTTPTGQPQAFICRVDGDKRLCRYEAINTRTP